MKQPWRSATVEERFCTAFLPALLSAKGIECLRQPAVLKCNGELTMKQIEFYLAVVQLSSMCNVSIRQPRAMQNAG